MGPLMEYGNQRQPLIFMCVRLLGSHLFILSEGECEVKQSAAGQL